MSRPQPIRSAGKAWVGFLMMAGSWALIFCSLSFFLEGKSIFGRLWIGATLAGLFVLALSYLYWQETVTEQPTAPVGVNTEAPGSIVLASAHITPKLNGVVVATTPSEVFEISVPATADRG